MAGEAREGVAGKGVVITLLILPLQVWVMDAVIKHNAMNTTITHKTIIPKPLEP